MGAKKTVEHFLEFSLHRDARILLWTDAGFIVRDR